MIKAVSFDVGHTLVNYKNPLSWASLYRPALHEAAAKCHMELSGGMVDRGVEILTKYNTRLHYRELEIPSHIIFNEIAAAWGCSKAGMPAFKSAFYAFFQAGAYPFPEVTDTLKALKALGIQLGVLTDAAYGMDNEFSLKDIESIRSYFDLILTSVDVGYRKPNQKGFLNTIEFFNIRPDEMIYVGDEEKDIAGANSVGAVSVLINRGGAVQAFNQDFTINNLHKLCGIIHDLSAGS